MSQLYFIRNLEREGGSNVVVWWKPNERGYTSDLSEAGFYTKEQATRITKAANLMKVEDIMVPVEEAQALSSNVVQKANLAHGFKP